MPPAVEALFVDIGGVLATNGWDADAHRRAAQHFGIDPDEMERRHHLVFDAYEAGTLTLRQFLDLAVFWRPRDFAPEDFEAYMFEQSQPFEDVIAFFRELKQRTRLRLVAVSNEGRELADYRNRAFGLGSFVDAFVISGHVGLRKPDPRMYRLALGISGVPKADTLVIDDRDVLIEAAAQDGLRTLQHTDLESTRRALAELGLK